MGLKATLTTASEFDFSKCDRTISGSVDVGLLKMSIERLFRQTHFEGIKATITKTTFMKFGEFRESNSEAGVIPFFQRPGFGGLILNQKYHEEELQHLLPAIQMALSEFTFHWTNVETQWSVLCDIPRGLAAIGASDHDVCLIVEFRIYLAGAEPTKLTFAFDHALFQKRLKTKRPSLKIVGKEKKATDSEVK